MAANFKVIAAIALIILLPMSIKCMGKFSNQYWSFTGRKPNQDSKVGSTHYIPLYVNCHVNNVHDPHYYLTGSNYISNKTNKY